MVISISYRDNITSAVIFFIAVVRDRFATRKLRNVIDLLNIYRDIRSSDKQKAINVRNKLLLSRVFDLPYMILLPIYVH